MYPFEKYNRKEIRCFQEIKIYKRSEYQTKNGNRNDNTRHKNISYE